MKSKKEGKVQLLNKIDHLFLFYFNKLTRTVLLVS